MIALNSSSESSTAEADPRTALDAVAIAPDATEAATTEAAATRAVAPGTSLFYKHLPVNVEGGVRLLDFQSANLRAKRIRAWVDDVAWRYAFGGPTIDTPLGNGAGADANWVFPGFVQFHVILFQPGGITFHFNGTPGNEQEFVLDNTLDIIINVNDVKGTYGDNNGAYSLNVEVLET
jgi:hypothetical protein